jgi:hypothetical protein
MLIPVHWVNIASVALMKSKTSTKSFSDLFRRSRDAMSVFDAYRMQRLSCLRSLKIKLDENDLELDVKIPWLHNYNDLDIVRIPIVAQLLELRGLRQVKVSRATSMETTPDEVRKISTLLRKIEDLFNDVTT